MLHGAAATQKSDSPRAREYNRIHRWLTIADAVLGVGVLVVLLAFGLSEDLRDIALNLAGHYYSLGLLFYIVMLTLLSKLAGLPLDYYGFRLEHRFELSNQKLRSWIRDEFKSYAVGLVIAAVLIELLYLTIRVAPRSWWVIAWLGFIALFVFFAQIAPVVLFPLFYKFEPLDNEELRDRLIRLSERAGTRVRGVFEWKLSEKSKKANAALAGLGGTRRIIISDTLLSNYTPDEIEAVLAHELGHHVHQHIFKSIFVQMAISFFGFWAANAVLRWAVEQRQMFAYMSDFANLPLLLLVSTGLSLLLLPALNAYSRHNEREADLYCWRAIPSISPFISSMNKLCDQNLAERHPSRAVELLFHSHPAVVKRIAAAEDWLSRQRLATPPRSDR
jgi:Zn-dependent protease with chaperone function